MQQNIWLPEEVLPQFRSSQTALYERLTDVSKIVMDAIGVGLGLDADGNAALAELISDRHCQLRLLHYPAISKAKLENELLARLPAHNDWGLVAPSPYVTFPLHRHTLIFVYFFCSTFTLLFQDGGGGLELKDPQTQDFMHAEPEEGTFVLNIGDMLQRFTNGMTSCFLTRTTAHVQLICLETK